MAVWDDVVGQDRVTEQLAAAARDADALVAAASAGPRSSADDAPQEAATPGAAALPR
ncbi:hypothetical protein O1L55_07840 [Streptomyces albulus]|nr:hypothetical protein [Streptomyces noursei]